MTAKLSGQGLGKENLQAFLAWVNERDAAGDWLDYIFRGKLNRSELASECGFALSVVRQNPAVKAALEALEYRLKDSGILSVTSRSTEIPGELAEASSQAIDKRIMAAKSKAEERVKALEEQNAGLRAEISSLRNQLARFQHLDEHLGRTGRLLTQ